MKVGTLAYCTEQGLGILAKSFYDAGIITDVCIIHHGAHINHREWYPNAPVIHATNDLARAQQFAATVDVMLFFETPFYWKLIPYCRNIGVKTILMPMYECTRYPNPYCADKILCPSLLDLQYYPQGKFLQVPVSVPWKLREKATTFIHNAGHGSVRSRNGTRELIEAMRLVTSPVRLKLRTQSKSIITNCSIPDNIDVVYGTVPYNELWSEGDVFIFPEKFNGLSLPLQEARASGLLVIASDRFPVNTWLPAETLVPVHRYEQMTMFAGAPRIEEAVVEPKDIAEAIDHWYYTDITAYSLAGKAWAETNDWGTWKPLYEDFIRS